MKEMYQEPQMQVCEFENIDIITTSSDLPVLPTPGPPPYIPWD